MKKFNLVTVCGTPAALLSALAVCLLLLGCSSGPAGDDGDGSNDKKFVITGLSAKNSDNGTIWLADDGPSDTFVVVAIGNAIVSDGKLTATLKAGSSSDASMPDFTSSGDFYCQLNIVSATDETAKSLYIYKANRPDSDFSSIQSAMVNMEKLSFNKAGTTVDISKFADITALYPSN